ncbi:Phosphoglycerol transferase I [Escherichia coli]|uniref:Phosphoglycerol transferase I n=1 Tax=Escherichia coli TaxID=562 RepID=A0A377APH6_ECOLX|nr:Phosphoglycerol transferase I [Escherichia coli]
MVLSRVPVTAKKYDFDGKPNQSFSAVSCSQENIATFINKIKASPWFKDTVIVVSSDHLAMNNTAWKYLNKQDRNNLFFVIRGDKPQQETLAVKRNTMDNGATVLDILGGDNYLGLGRSSLSGQSNVGNLPQYQRENIGVEAGYHPPVEIP